MHESATVSVAVVQAAPQAFELDATLEKMQSLLEQATRRGAKLVLFPEAFIGGYPKGADFGVRIGQRSDAGRDWFARYFAGAIDVPGPATRRLGQMASELGIHLITGVIERDGGTLYCSVVHFDEGGQLIGRRRKTMPTAMERVLWGCGDASTLDVTRTPYGNVGAAICWENYMPLLRTHFYRQQVQIYCAPTVDDRDVWVATMRHIAVEGRCFVLAACQFAQRRDYPADYECAQGNDPDAILIRGGSAIVDPFGELIQGPVYDQEAILEARIDLTQIARGKFDLDVAGHYARPDLFQLQVSGPDSAG